MNDCFIFLERKFFKAFYFQIDIQDSYKSQDKVDDGNSLKFSMTIFPINILSLIHI